MVQKQVINPQAILEIISVKLRLANIYFLTRKCSPYTNYIAKISTFVLYHPNEQKNLIHSEKHQKTVTQLKNELNKLRDQYNDHEAAGDLM